MMTSRRVGDSYLSISRYATSMPGTSCGLYGSLADVKLGTSDPTTFDPCSVAFLACPIDDAMSKARHDQVSGQKVDEALSRVFATASIKPDQRNIVAAHGRKRRP
jgi:hypothetical protein